jgi:hypothetical protein
MIKNLNARVFLSNLIVKDLSTCEILVKDEDYLEQEYSSKNEGGPGYPKYNNYPDVVIINFILN